MTDRMDTDGGANTVQVHEDAEVGSNADNGMIHDVLDRGSDAVERLDPDYDVSVTVQLEVETDSEVHGDDNSDEDDSGPEED